MAAIDNIRRDLREASYLRYSTVPFAGAVHDFAKPLRQRFAQRQYTGPYYFQPTEPGKGRCFYQSSHALSCDKSGSTFALRLELANDHLRGSRLARVNGYYVDGHCGDTMQPIVARLPHGRGFLAGWTMGTGMLAAIDAYVWDDIEDAARAAHDMAERDADKNRESNEDEEAGIYEPREG